VNAIRRTAVLLGLAVALVVGSSIPASAAWSASSAQQRATLSTLVVEAATNLRVNINCVDSTMYATVGWNASPSAAVPKARVSGYALVANVAGQQINASVPAGQNSYVYSTGRVWSAQVIPISVTVTTQTAFGWVKVSAPLTGSVTTC
jgi:hypothetical protein